MKIVADLHLHSYFSRATSKSLNLENLHKWAQLKGINLVGTGDIAHPGWLKEMREKLEPAEEGLFKLKQEIARPYDAEVYKPCQAPVRFMLAGEISNIYKRNDKVRKIHNVVFMPSFSALEKFQARLEKIGNIRSDGRPILGLDSRDLLEIVLETDPRGYLIPAHIWTPWFAMLGSKSGFDSVEECFDDLSNHIFALETGLSSDPPMNWRLSILDKYTLVSNSDAHSPQKLAREANIFETELSYSAIFDALKTGDHDKFKGTLEFFPEEGKYHYDGHRKCEIRWHPKTTLENNCICPVCGNTVTVGVMHRAELLADRDVDEFRSNRHPFRSLVPLPEMLSEIHNVGATSKRVNKSFNFLLSKLGSELYILLDAPLEDIEHIAGPMVSEGIRRMRNKELQIDAGFDGEFGKVRMFDEQERKQFSSQLNFFVQQVETAENKSVPNASPGISEQTAQYKKKDKSKNKQALTQKIENKRHNIVLNEEQAKALQIIDTSLLISAGPGTGKTRTLTHRIAYLIKQKNIDPKNILALTFTNKAAEEMQNRLNEIIGAKDIKRLTISTFHSFCSFILRNDGDKIGLSNFQIADEADQIYLLKKIRPKSPQKQCRSYLELFNHSKINLHPKLEVTDDETNEILSEFENLLKKYNLLTIEELICKTVELFKSFPEILKKYQSTCQYISVDEYQDVNLAQYHLLQLLCSEQTNICVIGDPDQAIYGFRGSDRNYFLKFEQDFSNVTTVALTQNYRSSQTILDASSQVIIKDGSKEHKKTWSEISSEIKIDIYAAPTDKAEAEYIVHETEKMVGGTSYFSMDSGRVDDSRPKANYGFSDFAVFYRTKVQARLLKIAFERSGMPFQIIGEKSFYNNSLIRKILNYLNFITAPDNDLYLEKILNDNHLGISKKTASEILEHCQTQSIGIWHHLKNLPDSLTFVSELSNLLNLKYTLKVSELLEHIKNQFFPDHYFEDDEQARLFSILLKKSESNGHGVKEFLHSIILLNENDQYEPNADKITLMTLHASKGLEFPVVFIIGCEENLIPYNSENRRTDLAEERRLFYVGMTRAQQRLILTRAKKRTLYGKSYTPLASPFLNDIEDKLKVEKYAQRKLTKKVLEENKSQMKLF